MRTFLHNLFSLVFVSVFIFYFRILLYLSSRIHTHNDHILLENTCAMTSTPELNDLTTWLQAHLSALYESPATADDADFQASFDSTFSPSAQIIVNHQALSLDQFKDNLLSSKAAMTRATVHWKEVMQVDSPGERSGIVAGFFVVTRTMKFRIRAGPAQNNGYNSFSAKIDQDPGVPSTKGDNWRITQLFLTTENKAAPIHLQSAAEHVDAATIDPSLIE